MPPLHHTYVISVYLTLLNQILAQTTFNSMTSSADESMVVTVPAYTRMPEYDHPILTDRNTSDVPVFKIGIIMVYDSPLPFKIEMAGPAIGKLKVGQ